MNAWLLSAIFVLLALFPPLWVCARGKLMERFVALQMAQLLTVLLLLIFAVGYQRDIYLMSHWYWPSFPLPPGSFM